MVSKIYEITLILEGIFVNKALTPLKNLRGLKTKILFVKGNLIKRKTPYKITFFNKFKKLFKQ